MLAPINETLPQKSRFQSISEHIVAQLARKTKPVTIFIKNDYHVVQQVERRVRKKKTLATIYPVGEHLKTY
jgi:hypothetical protein